MEILILPDAGQAERKTAEVIAEALARKPDMVLGLATGRTMEQVYAHLVEFHRRGGLDFSRCSSFNLDEYVGLAPDDERSYRSYMNRHLFDHINIRREAIHIPDGVAADRAEECRKYEVEIGRLGGIDLQLLGLGADGHIGFNEPRSGLYSRPAKPFWRSPHADRMPECSTGALTGSRSGHSPWASGPSSRRGNAFSSPRAVRKPESWPRR